MPTEEIYIPTIEEINNFLAKIDERKTKITTELQNHEAKVKSELRELELQYYQALGKKHLLEMQDAKNKKDLDTAKQIPPTEGPNSKVVTDK